MLVVVAVYYDIRTYKIPNRFILLGYLFSCFFQLKNGIAGFREFFIGASLPIISLVFLQRMGVIGGGDVKLLSVVGSFFGRKEGIYSLILSFIFGAILSLFFLIQRGVLKTRIRFFLDYIQTVVHTGKWIPYYQIAKDGYSGTIHFSIAVLAAVLVLLWL